MSMAASLPSVGGYSSGASSIYAKRNTTNILERHLNKTRGAEVNKLGQGLKKAETLKDISKHGCYGRSE